MGVESRMATGASAALSAALLDGLVLAIPGPVQANHPVLVEGNCDSPVPGTTVVDPGNCGDFDGDGRIGTAEDTDGADRIFGTIEAALGPGTGAAAGTGANMNGTVTIVKSGRFAESLRIGSPAPSIGSVTLEAAPGVLAEIDAVLQGDPAGGNPGRMEDFGIIVDTPDDVHVTLRNLVVRNFRQGISIMDNSHVAIDNVRVHNNRDFGIVAQDGAQVTITNSQVIGTGFRVSGGSVNDTPNPGTGIAFQGNARGFLAETVIATSVARGLHNETGDGANAVRILHVVTFDNSPNIAGPVTKLP